MKVKPLVALVGRPNVGKSTLFNRIVGRRIAVVSETAGTTRDRLYADSEWSGVMFSLVDTGGIEVTAGWRTEPPVSVPIATGAKRAATAAAEPPDDPPGTRSKSHGLWVV